MQNTSNLLRVTLLSIRDAVVITDTSARVLEFNRAAEAMTGWSSQEAAGQQIEHVLNLRSRNRRLHDLRPRDPRQRYAHEYAHDPFSPEGTETVLNPVLILLRENATIDPGEQFLLVGRNGLRTAAQITVSRIEDSQGDFEGYILVLHDVSEAVQLAEHISYLAHHDPLTGLPNRILFVDRLEQGTRFADRKSDQLAVMSVDLDGFGDIQRSFGEALADDMLREVAYRMLAALRESDTVSRLGGDEFILMAPGIRSFTDIEAVAEKLLAELAQPCVLGEHTLQTTCSIGISVYPHDAIDAGTLMRLADGAMNNAKSEGGNRYIFAKAHLSEAQAQDTPS